MGWKTKQKNVFFIIGVYFYEIQFYFIFLLPVHFTQSVIYPRKQLDIFPSGII